MLLESARALKAELYSYEDAGDEPLAFAAAASAGPVRSSISTPLGLEYAPVAIGLTGEGQKAKLAIRAFAKSPEVRRIIETISARAKNEVDIAYLKPLRPLPATSASTMKAPTPAFMQRRHRPLIIGCSSGHFGITAGTLGCFVRGKRDGKTYLLSNNHVYANTNSGRPGDPILQPGPTDGGTRTRDIVAKLSNFVPISANARNFIDAAIAGLQPGVTFDAANIPGIGAHKGVRAGEAPIGQSVQKVGRTTGLTSGRIRAIELDGVRVNFGPGLGVVTFDDQIEIVDDGRAFSAGGDSGSAIWDMDRRLVGLLFAGGGNTTYANPIGAVLRALNVELI
jgi:hypothetical protein